MRARMGHKGILSSTSKRMALVIMGSLALAACGGGGSSSGGSGGGVNPPPPPPPPPPPTNSTLVNLQYDEDFKAHQVVLGFDIANDGTISNVAAEKAASGKAAYDASSAEFAITASSSAFSFVQAFNAANIDDAASDASFRVYTVDAGGGTTHDFIMLIPGDPTYGQTYSTLGIWNTPNLTMSEDAKDIAFGSIVFGIRTTSTAVPTTGSATYTGPSLGMMADGGQVYRLSGDLSLSVAFSSNTLSGGITNMVKENIQTGGLSAWQNLTLAGNIGATRNGFTGTAISADNLWNGTFNGSFFGPVSGGKPAELGGTFELTGPDAATQRATGAFVGK
ncbi:MAG: transferrin-binding protein-like solute binding protein [Sphingomonadales bacterium]|nr:transferrin-binding protein-like solute binding protein [Sphingomonadales bacterium]